MQPVSTDLCSEYLYELLDPYHRVYTKSKVLYDEWLETNQELSFAQWIEANKHFPNSPNEQVLYINDINALEPYQVSFVNGLAQSQNSLLTCDRDLKKYSIPLALVIRADNNKLYSMQLQVKEGKRIRIHHSTATCGQPVFFAAEGFAKAGKFIEITDKSGHYKPNLQVFMYGIEQMLLQGALLSDTKFMITRDGEQVRYIGDDFLNLYLDKGFNHENYRGEILDIQMMQFGSGSGSLGQDGIYFDRATNDLYEILTIDEQIVITAFTVKYEQLEQENLAAREEKWRLGALARRHQAEKNRSAEASSLETASPIRGIPEIKRSGFSTPMFSTRLAGASPASSPGTPNFRSKPFIVNLETLSDDGKENVENERETTVQVTSQGYASPRSPRPSYLQRRWENLSANRAVHSDSEESATLSPVRKRTRHAL